MAKDPSNVKDQVQGARLHKTNNDTKNNAKAVSMECLQARLAERPEILLAVAGAQTAVGIGLAALGRRSGRGSLVLGTLSGLAFTDAASPSGLYAVLRRQRRRRGGAQD